MSFVLMDAHLPAQLSCEPMTDDEFMLFCSEHSDLRFETTAEGELLVTAPTGFNSGVRNVEIARQLAN